MGSLLKWLLVQSDKLDEWLRFHDFHAHRTVGGRLDRFFHISRHTVSAVILPCFVCGLMLLASPSALPRFDVPDLATGSRRHSHVVYASLGAEELAGTGGPGGAKLHGIDDGRGDLDIRQE